MKKDKTIEKLKDRYDYLADVSDRNRPGGKSLLDEALELFVQNQAKYQSLNLWGKIKWQIKEYIYLWKYNWKTRHEPSLFSSLSNFQLNIIYPILFLMNICSIIMSIFNILRR